ncbi:DUF4236 domain-containing protein [Clostridium chauvoei]|uniref:DUF4236 domain-containing protein n=2 Tax=Clostridium chauvoei TaxID=46867 RepID=A0ABD4RH87_9CLOT|nr:DUF4236 domain-containing protein [Clostridium chauvoei]MBX7280737.1 DUF4236 domain-containing protein [Clostridium chauvoei]MBX7283220.1 DUF4236 domain-containing protein [Clostridium chauvoei]MBX7285895.1 DUF4236 domain-containing protein [Clostridium chauvoei]MBX7288289.1 DUF4236 domain-containing protein [Clostridium chauvoei]MBX7290822.1 DUF4236 domain-containing protein [Clostridium chauvoei]
MGFRFKKSKNFGPFRVNVSKSGIGWSVGTKGARFTKRADGKKQTTLSIPGTGLSYVDVSGDKKNSSTNSKTEKINFSNNNNDNKPKIPFHKRSWFIWLMLILLPPVGIVLLWTSKKYNKKPRVALSIIFALYAMILFIPHSNTATQNNLVAQETKNEQEKIEKERAEKERIDKEESEKKKAAQEKAEKEKIAAEEAEKKKVAEEKTAAEEAEKQRIAQEKAASEEAEKQRTYAEQSGAAQTQTSTAIPQANQGVGQTVYIASSGKGKKYHSNPNCSKMNGATPLSKDEALNLGYTPCQKCH